MSETLEAPFGGRKLFAVEITEEIYVLAFDDEDATEIAQEQAGCGGNIDWNDANYMADEAAWVARPWANSIPFGRQGNEKDATCQEIWDALQEYEKAQPPTQAELESLGQQRLV